MNRKCEQPGCGREKKPLRLFGVPLYWACDREADAHVLCARVAELEAKLAGVDDALVSCYYHDDCQAPAYCGVCANAIRDGHEPNCAVPQAITREEARKKGAEHGE